MSKITKETTLLDCPLCHGKKSVMVIKTEDAIDATLEVKKCNQCKYPFGIKELTKLFNPPKHQTQ